jgi:hypothetical protein
MLLVLAGENGNGRANDERRARPEGYRECAGDYGLDDFKRRSSGFTLAAQRCSGLCILDHRVRV